MPKPLIFVNRYFYPDHSATSQMLSDLAFWLAETGGFEVHVVASRQRYDDASAALAAEEQAKGVHIHRVWTSRFGRGNLAGRAIDYGSFYLSAFACLLRRADRRATIIAKTDPPLLSVVAALAAKLRRARLVNWLQDVFPEAARAMGVGLARGPLYGLLRSARNLSLSLADLNVVIGESMRRRLEADVPGGRFRVIPNWADAGQIRPVPPVLNGLRRAWGLEGKFVAGYSGNLGRSHEFATLLDAAEALGDSPDIAFLIIGGGARLPAVRRAVAERGLPNFVFKPYQPRENLAESLSAADVHLISLRPELEGLIVPSKFYGIAAAGRPVLLIGAADGESARLIGKAGCGYQIAPGDARGLAERIRALAADPRLAAELGRFARRWLDAEGGMNTALRAWAQALSGPSAEPLPPPITPQAVGSPGIPGRLG
jgi:glycosyltransferase involved in cell wall biosynthesis